MGGAVRTVASESKESNENINSKDLYERTCCSENVWETTHLSKGVGKNISLRVNGLQLGMDSWLQGRFIGPGLFVAFYNEAQLAQVMGIA